MRREHTSALRLDIEGLRAVAIGLVLVYHAGGQFLPGGFIGVDVFFVISGFLITGILVREAESSGRVSLARFYARRAKRLLPIASVVLIVAAIVSATLSPTSQTRMFGLDIVGAALYVVNWVFANRSVDYASQDAGVSPVLHFWSLSVEEQFYIVWPLLLLAVVLLVRGRVRLVRPAMGAGLLLIVAPSLAWSIILTGRQDASAFFVTSTRLWELGIGGLLAIAVPRVRSLPAWVGHVLAIVGTAIVAYAALEFDDSMGWPGAVALVPVLGTAAVIAAGIVAPRGPISLALSWRPFVWIGGLSYSLYLWHWVVIIAGRDGYGLQGEYWGLALVALSFVPAFIGHHLVENPIRFSTWFTRQPSMALLIGGVASLVSVTAGLTTTVTALKNSAPVAEDSIAPALRPMGAAALGTDPKGSAFGRPRYSYPAIWPPLTESALDVPSYTSRNCFTQPTESDLKPCDTGDLDSNVHVVIVGDSKMSQWFDAIDIAAQANGWRVTMYAKGSCPFSEATRVRNGQLWNTCSDWNDAALSAILDSAPAAVITTQGSRTAILPENAARGSETPEDAIDGLARRWARLNDAGIPVIVLADNPRPPMGYDAITCLVEKANDATSCAFARQDAIQLSGMPAQFAAAKRARHAAVVDLTDYLCPHDLCAPVVGNVLLYRKAAHITNTYAMSAAPILTERLAAAARKLGVRVPADGS